MDRRETDHFKNLIIGCGENFTGLTESGMRPRIPTNASKATSPKKMINHQDLHPSKDYLTMDSSLEFTPSVQGNLMDAELLKKLDNSQFSQIILEHIPPIALNKQAMHNLFALLKNNGICLLVLSRYAGRSVGSVSMDIATKVVTGVEYKRDEYEFFLHLKSAGFKTILILDDTGLNFVLFKEDVEQAKKIFEEAQKKSDYLGQILRNEVLVSIPFALAWCTVNEAVSRSTAAFDTMLSISSEQIQTFIDKQPKELEISELKRLISDDSLEDKNNLDIFHGIFLLAKYQVLEKRLLNNFISHYNNAFIGSAYLNQLKNDELVEAKYSFYSERKQFKYQFISRIEKTIQENPTLSLQEATRKVAAEDKNLFDQAIRGKKSRLRDEVMIIMGNEQQFNQFKKSIEEQKTEENLTKDSFKKQ